MMTTIVIIIIAILGASIGSFLSVVLDRIKKGKKGIFFGRSMCPHCKKTLSTLDLVPILSYLFLRGRCRYCKKTISPHYPSLEIISALVFVTLFFRFPFIAENAQGYAISGTMLTGFILYAIYSTFFIAIFFYDLQHREIPDIFLFPLLAFTLIGSIITGSPEIPSMLIAAAIALFFFGGQLLVSRGRWLGEGDLYLSLSMALLFGWQLMLVSMVITYVIGGIIGLLLLLTKKVTAKTQVPFAPFLVLGTFMTMFFGHDILAWYLGSLTI